MTTPLIFPALIVTCIFGPVQACCVLGYFLLRQRTVFAVRVPAMVLGCMIHKTIAFGLCAWMFLDPNCPCAIGTVLLWFESIANYHSALQKIILLFRYELQAVFEKSKESNALITLDERNLYVKYRRVLRTKPQYKLMVGVSLILAVAFFTVLGVFSDEAQSPCLNDTLADNLLFQWSLIMTYAGYVPLLCISVYTTKRLKAFPKDNWKVYTESLVSSYLTIAIGILWIVIPAAVPGYAATLFVVLVTAHSLPLTNFMVPLQLHRRRVLELAKMDLKQLTQLARLLREPPFVTAFELFLKTEFSSENLFFWLDVDSIVTKYKDFAPRELTDRSTQSAKPAHDLERLSTDGGTWPEGEAQTILAAAQACCTLGHQCIGDSAPWQINVSGPTAEALGRSIKNLKELVRPGITDQQLEGGVKLLEDALRCLMVAQMEVYEGLRRDSYPRFTLTPACIELNNDESLKKILASEKLDEEHPEGWQKMSAGSDTTRKPRSTSRRTFDMTLPTAGTSPWSGKARDNLKEREPDLRGSDGDFIVLELPDGGSPTPRDDLPRESGNSAPINPEKAEPFVTSVEGSSLETRRGNASFIV